VRRAPATSILVALCAAGLWQCASKDAAAPAMSMRDEGDSGYGGPSYTGTGGAMAIDEGDPNVDIPSLPPEQEVEPTFKAPVATGRLVWAANPASDRVALVDAVDLPVTAVEVGRLPPYIAAIPSPGSDDATRAIVVNVAGDDASLLTALGGVVYEQRVPLQPRVNSWAVSASGRWVVAWTNAEEVEGGVDPTEGFQDITVIAVPDPPAQGDDPDAPRAFRLSVGYRPTRLFLTEDEARLYVVSDAGITEIALDSAVPTVVQDLGLEPDATTASSTSAGARDVAITPNGRFALVRRDGSRSVEIWELSTGERRDVELSGPVTDLDLVADGSRAIAVVRSVVREGGEVTGGSGGSAGAPATGGGAGAPSSGGVAATGGGAGAPSSGGVAATGGASGGAGGVAGTGISEAGAAGAGVAAAGVAGAANAVAGAPSGRGEAGALPALSGAAGAAGVPAAAAGASSAGAGPGPDVPAAPNTSEIFILSIPEIFDDPTRFDRVAIEDVVVGSVSASIEGERALLYTNATPSDVLTILDTRPGADYLTSRAVALINPIRSVYPAPDALHAIALLDPVPGQSVLPGAFAVVPIDALAPPRVQGTDAPPVAVALAPSPSTRGIVTVRDDQTGVYGAYLVRMPELQVDRFDLASPPTATGLVPVARRAFIAQEHVGGRITFIDLDGTGSVSELARTLTGFELEARVVGDASGRD